MIWYVTSETKLPPAQVKAAWARGDVFPTDSSRHSAASTVDRTQLDPHDMVVYTRGSTMFRLKHP